MTDDELLDFSEEYEAERRRWFVRRNDANPSGERWEVCLLTHKPDEPISDSMMKVMVRAYDYDTASYEMENLRGIESMRAALAKPIT